MLIPRILLTATALVVAVFVQAQQIVPVGRGSYASYTPLANCRSTRHAVEWGNSSCPIRTAIPIGNNVYYLSGQRVNGRFLPAGIYVSGGKKIIVGVRQ